ncbi:hypothetical protein B0H10DRAFT_2103070 [Mycena sp. CBHHK59/15]|nr:hypothetical protein B0H10DRAFT_2103070 [Mycena sp. CBHHK59/15]
MAPKIDVDMSSCPAFDPKLWIGVGKTYPSDPPWEVISAKNAVLELPAHAAYLIPPGDTPVASGEVASIAAMSVSAAKGTGLQAEIYTTGFRYGCYLKNAESQRGFTSEQGKIKYLEKACLSCKRRKTRCDPHSPCLQCSIVNGPTAELVRVSKRKSKANTDIDGITAVLAKLNERLDFVEATIFGWTLPIEQVHHKETSQDFQEENPWAEALARRRRVASQSLSGSTAYDSSYDASISAHASGSGSSPNFLFDFDTFPWDGESARVASHL